MILLELMNLIVANKVWFMTTLLQGIDSLFKCIYLTKLFIYIHIIHRPINTLTF